MDVVGANGQSNIASANGLDLALDGDGGGVYQVGRFGGDFGKVIGGSEPLHHNEAVLRTTEIGPASSFARRYFAETNRRVLLAPSGKGGTGFDTSLPLGTNVWNAPDGDLFLEAVATMNRAIRLHPANEIKVIIHAGHEANAGRSEAEISPYFDALIEGYRALVDGAGPTTPIIFTGMPPDWADANAPGVRDALQALPGRHEFVAYADPRLPFRLDRNADSDLIHYDAVEAREMGTNRIWTAYQSLVG